MDGLERSARFQRDRRVRPRVLVALAVTAIAVKISAEQLPVRRFCGAQRKAPTCTDGDGADGLRRANSCASERAAVFNGHGRGVAIALLHLSARTGDSAAAAQHEIDEAAQLQQPVGGVDDAAATDTPAHEPSLLKSDAAASDGATDIATQSQSPKPADQTEAPAGDSSVAHPGETDVVAQLNKQQDKDGSLPVTTSEPEVEKLTRGTGGVRVTSDEDERAGGRICSIFC